MQSVGEAMAIGRITNKLVYIDELKKIIELFPNEAEAKEATNIISTLSGNNINTYSLYNFIDNVEHFYILNFTNTGIKTNDIQVALSDFNKEFFSLENLIIKSLFLNENYQLITVRGLINSEKAIKYFNAMKENENVLRHLNGNNYDHFVISSNNFTMYYANKNTESYLDFFKTNYLTKN